MTACLLYTSHRVGFQIILADGILERFAEDGVVVNDRVGGVALQQIGDVVSGLSQRVGANP